MPPKKKVAVVKKKPSTVEMPAAEQDRQLETLLENKTIHASLLGTMKSEGYQIDRPHSNLHLPLLHAVIRRRDLRKCEAALAAGASPAFRDSLTVAVENEDAKKKKKKAEPPKKKKETSAAVTEDLYSALVTRRIEQEDGGNALHLAASLNDTEIVARILSHPESGSLLTIKNLRGLSPLGVAVLLGHTRVARQLLGVIENTSELDNKGRGLLFHAVAMCHADMVTLLLPSFAASLESALTDRQGVRAIALVLNAPSAAACATLLVLESAVKGAVAAKFPAETFDFALQSGNVELAKLAIGNANTEKLARLVQAAVGAQSVASCRGFLALVPTSKLDADAKTALLGALDEVTEFAHVSGRDQGHARLRLIAELRERLLT